MKFSKWKALLVSDARDVPQMQKDKDCFTGLCSTKDANMMARELVFEELYTNVGKYAYDDKKKAPCFVFYGIKKNGRCVLLIMDKGKPFNPVKYEPQPVDGHRVGGNGLRMVKSLVVNIKYKRALGFNCLHIEME